MDILHKTQKQHLPLILFFFNTNCNFGKKKRGTFKSGNLQATPFSFQSNCSNKASVEKKKKKFLWMTKPLHLTTIFVWKTYVWLINQTIFFLKRSFFLNDFCSFNKRKVLKREAFSQRFATARWQTEKDTIFGGEKKMIHVKPNEGTSCGSFLISLKMQHEKLSTEEQEPFSFSSRLLSIFS